MLQRARPPVLDIGCGPGRHVLALSERGTMAMGVDVTPVAVALARGRGAPVLERSIFDRVPAHGRWRTALLLDGNVGIGGDPIGLLRRVSTLLAGDGCTLAEVDVERRVDPCAPVPTAARLEVAGITGPWFPWVAVGFDELLRAARMTGLAVHDRWNHGGRQFVELRRRPIRSPR